MNAHPTRACMATALMVSTPTRAPASLDGLALTAMVNTFIVFDLRHDYMSLYMYMNQACVCDTAFLYLGCVRWF